MSIEQIPRLPHRPVVYALMCEGEKGDGYMKIGRSSSFASRYKSLKTSCPLPIGMIGLIHATTVQHSEIIERAFHIRMKPRVSSGEWFALNFRDPLDKAYFKEVTREVIDLLLPNSSQTWWDVFDPESADGILEQMLTEHHQRDRMLKASKKPSVYRVARESLLELLDRKIPEKKWY